MLIDQTQRDTRLPAVTRCSGQRDPLPSRSSVDLDMLTEVRSTVRVVRLREEGIL